MNRGAAEERKKRGKGGREHSPSTHFSHGRWHEKLWRERERERPHLNDPTMTTSSFGPRYYPHPRRNIPLVGRVVFQLGSGWDGSRRAEGGGWGAKPFPPLTSFAKIDDIEIYQSLE